MRVMHSKAQRNGNCVIASVDRDPLRAAWLWTRNGDEVRGTHAWTSRQSMLAVQARRGPSMFMPSGFGYQ